MTESLQCTDRERLKPLGMLSQQNVSLKTCDVHKISKMIFFPIELT